MDDARVERLPYARDETSSHGLTFLLPLGQFIFRYRNAMFPIILLVLLMGLRPRIYLSGYWELVFDLVGLLAAGLGQALHVAVLGAAPIKRGGLNKRVYADRLVTDGCFAHCRNPIYVGNLLIVAGLLIVFNNILAFIIVGIFLFVSYNAIIVAEETFLLRQFGQEYRSYCEQVPSLVARVQGVTIYTAEYFHKLVFGGLKDLFEHLRLDDCRSCCAWLQGVAFPRSRSDG